MAGLQDQGVQRLMAKQPDNVQIITPKEDDPNVLSTIDVAQQFDAAAHAMQVMATRLDMQLVYTDGVYAIWPLPGSVHGDPAMGVMMDTTTEESIVFGDTWQHYRLDKLAIEQDGHGGNRLRIDIGGPCGRLSDRQQDILRGAAPYIGVPENVLEWQLAKPGEKKAMTDSTGLSMIGAPPDKWINRWPSSDPLPGLSRRAQLEMADSNLKRLYPGMHQSWVTEIAQYLHGSYWRYLNFLEPEYAASIQRVYEQHIDAMRFIRNINQRYDLLTINDPYHSDNLYRPGGHPDTIRAAVRYNDLCASPIDILVTPLPFLVIGGVRASYWQSSDWRKSVPNAASIFDNPNRKYSDTHIPFMWEGGIDSYLSSIPDVKMDGGYGMTGVNRDVSLIIRESSYGVYANHVVGWLKTGDYGPYRNTLAPDLDFGAGRVSHWRTGQQYPWLGGYLHPASYHASGGHIPHCKRTSRRRVGLPVHTNMQSRNGLNNRVCQEAIQEMIVHDCLLNSNIFIQDFPWQHSLNMFFQLISRGGVYDVTKRR